MPIIRGKRSSIFVIGAVADAQAEERLPQDWQLAPLLCRYWNKKGLKIFSYAIQIGPIKAVKRDYSQIRKNLVGSPDPEAAILMEQLIDKMRSEKDSVGGIIETQIWSTSWTGRTCFDKPMHY